ncbi:MAG: hypothetical protein JWQ49_2532, partial [Edaphobacter sp.]|nr:hypothetical protein [Edaphobacter sp.]
MSHKVLITGAASAYQRRVFSSTCDTTLLAS